MSLSILSIDFKNYLMCSAFRWLNISKVYLLEAKKGKKYQPYSTYSWHGKFPLLEKAVILSYNSSPQLI